MAERRSLSAAIMEVPNAEPDQVRRFISQDMSREPSLPNDVVEPEPAPVRIAPSPATKITHEAKAMPSLRAKKRRSNGIQPVAPVPVTVRLRPEVAGGLKRASLERQLAGEDMFTQQDLVETLLEPWLREQGFLE